MLGRIGVIAVVAAGLGLLVPPALHARQQWVTGQTVNITGSVVTTDGTPPSRPAMVFLNCGGSADSSTQTESEGKFSIAVSVGARRENSTRPVPGYGIGGSIDMLEQRLRGCEVRVTLSGYTSAPVNLTGRRISDNPNIGTIVLRPLSRSGATSTPFSSLSAPNEARKAFETGMALLQKRQFEKARTSFEKAVEEHPQYAEAWYELGATHIRLQRVAEAAESFQRSVDADASYLKPRLGLFDLSLRSGDWRRILDASAAVIKLDARGQLLAWYFNGVANLQLGNVVQARQAADRTIQLDESRQFPKARHILGLALEAEGDLEGAAKALREYVAIDPGTPDIEAVRKRLIEIEAKLTTSR